MDEVAELQEIEESGLAAAEAAGSLAELEDARVALTGRKSRLAGILSGIGQLPPEKRGEVGKAANAVRVALEGAIATRHAALDAEEMEGRLADDAVDITLPGDPFPRGAIHPIMQVRREIEDIFLGLGYRIAGGPEIEDDHHNFVALNTPEGHPARTTSDTLYVEGPDTSALRPQTSPVQIHAMEAQDPPVYVIAPGTVYRRDDVDATHSPMFHQLEGLAVDEGLGMADLIGTLEHFVAEFFGGRRDTRIQPHFFPFTEPSIELYVRWTDKRGRDTWLELLGAGVVDPNVLSGVGYDPERWSGFAFGMGLDRLAMVRHGVPDLRLMYENDLRFLEQFA